MIFAHMNPSTKQPPLTYAVAVEDSRFPTARTRAYIRGAWLVGWWADR